MCRGRHTLDAPFGSSCGFAETFPDTSPLTAPYPYSHCILRNGQGRSFSFSEKDKFPIEIGTHLCYTGPI